jgi:CCR4-NOT transcription complex subunit 4
MGRKRKTKKAPSTTVDSTDGASASIAETAGPVKAAAETPKKAEPKPEPPKKVKEKEQPVPETKPVRLEEPPIQPKAPVEEAWRSHNTVKQANKDAEESGRSIKDILMERTKPLHEILAQMHKSGVLDLNKSSLFNPANLSQRTDMKCTADDYDQLKQPIDLTDEHRKALRRGEPVRIGNDQLKNRCLITPRGSVLRHLEAEEEERYLQLEKQRNGFTDPFVVGDDSSNINGGLDALFATPEKYNIRWVDEISRLGATSPIAALDAADTVVPPNVLSAMEADSTRSHDWAVAHSAELLQTTTAAVRSFAAATAKQMLGSAGMPGTNPSLDDVAAMTNEELKELAGRSQKDLESTRKELDSLDKKFAALLRRNKKVQHQALSMVDSPN